MTETGSIGNRGGPSYIKRGIRKELEALNAYLTNFQEELEWRMQHPDWQHNKARIPHLVITMNKLRKRIAQLQSEKHNKGGT
jgi:hypothetical protein